LRDGCTVWKAGDGEITYDVVEVRGSSIESHINVVSSVVEVLIVEGLVDIANELKIY
jgi:hypothetical protein